MMHNRSMIALLLIATWGLVIPSCDNSSDGQSGKIEKDIEDITGTAEDSTVVGEDIVSFETSTPTEVTIDQTGWQVIPMGDECVDAEEDCGIGGYCVPGPNGSVCTSTCISDCPVGWTCKGIDPEGTGLQFLCIPNYFDVCAPCSADAECGKDEDFCIAIGGEGTFCAIHCNKDADCPPKFACNTLMNLEGETVKQCIPLSNSCTCTPDNEGDTRACELENDFGSCPGKKACLGVDGWSECDAQEPAEEICDGLDNDCDGTVDDGFADADKDDIADCIDDDDDNDTILDAEDNCPTNANPGQFDLDKDGEGNACDADDDNDGDPDVIDCAPLDPLANHNAKEDCDGVDNNCNGQVDEGFADFDKDDMANCVDPDDDNDGDEDGDDCEPLNPTAHSNGQEVCDGVDNNCNGKTDEGSGDLDGDGIANCVDLDADGDGDPNDEDCAPFNAAISAGADEVCDGEDNNCNNQVDEGWPDFDKDGLANCVDPDDDNDGDVDTSDCAPLDGTKHNGAVEACDGDDNNCNGKFDEGFPNFDGDGEADCIDNDDDNDGDPDIVDCNPLSAVVYTGAPELCDSLDNDCNKIVDDSGALGCSMFYKDKDDDGWGMTNKVLCLCGPGEDYTATQPGDCDDSTWNVNPNGTEVCNNQDDDCDGITDNPGSLGCQNHYVDSDGDNYGSGAPICICWPNTEYTTTKGGDCNEDSPSINPGIDELCDKVDNNCNGIIDEGVSSSCGNCDPTCHQVSIGPDGDEAFTPDDDNSSNVSVDAQGSLKSTAQGYYRHIIPGAPFGTTNWASLFVEFAVTGSANIKIRMRAANTISGIADKTWVGPFGPFPPNVFPLDLTAISGLSGKYLEAEVMTFGNGGSNAITISSFAIQYHTQ
jgi:hypothetical protein